MRMGGCGGLRCGCGFLGFVLGLGMFLSGVEWDAWGVWDGERGEMWAMINGLSLYG